MRSILAHEAHAPGVVLEEPAPEVMQQFGASQNAPEASPLSDPGGGVGRVR